MADNIGAQLVQLSFIVPRLTRFKPETLDCGPGGVDAVRGRIERIRMTACGSGAPGYAATDYGRQYNELVAGGPKEFEVKEAIHQ